MPSDQGPEQEPEAVSDDAVRRAFAPPTDIAPPTDTAPPAGPVPPGGAVPPSIPGQFAPPAPAVPPPGGAANPYAPPGQLPPAWGGHPGYWQPVPQPSGTNRLAIASLVLGILGGFGGFAWLGGLACGINGLRQIKGTGQRGRGLAISGIVLSVGWLVMLGFTLSYVDWDRVYNGPAVPTAGHSNGPVTSNGTVPVFSLGTGDCVDRISPKGTVFSVKRVPCSEPHNAEVFAIVHLGTGSYPGDTKLSADSGRRCQAEENDYVLDSWAEPATVEVRYYRPDSVSWRSSGDNRTICILSATSGSLQGSLRKDRSKVTPEQFGYLYAENEVTDAWNGGPDEDTEVTDEPEEFRAWARRLSTALDHEKYTLQKTTWGDGSKQPIADLLAELTVEQQHLDAAAKAADADTLESELEEAYRHDAAQQIKAVRASLGLSTDDPADHPGSNSGPHSV